jgi:uncharacterized protein with gpF-like domain
MLEETMKTDLDQFTAKLEKEGKKGPSKESKAVSEDVKEELKAETKKGETWKDVRSCISFYLHLFFCKFSKVMNEKVEEIRAKFLEFLSDMKPRLG